MRTTSTPLALLSITTAIALAACSDLPSSTDGQDQIPTANESLAVSLDELGSDAALIGDTEAATAFHDGALAIRLGAVPSEITLSVAGEEQRFRAVVTAIASVGPDGRELMRRSIIAWRGQNRPEAVLRLIARADNAVFGGSDISSDPSLAVGRFADFVRHARFHATDGSLASPLATLGGRCPNAAEDRRFACNLARFDVRLDGLFDLTSDRSVRVRIFTESTGISGVVVRRTDGGSGGRPTPTANPTRPVT